mmetsp:Transcript_143/g.242  ORF Transcript_143/g.242 Transcript_143/m.242 type:complete len:258 (+) Transcript_143:384-1157(+)
MHLHDLTIHLILLGTPPLFLLTLSLLLSLSHAALPLSKHDHGKNTALFLETDKFLVHVIQCLANFAANRTCNVPIDELILVLLESNPLTLLAVILQSLDSTELLDKLQTFCLRLKHLILNCTSTQETLQKDDPKTLFVVLRDRSTKFGCGRTDNNRGLAVLCKIVLFVSSSRQVLLLDRCCHPVQMSLHLPGLSCISCRGKLGHLGSLDLDGEHVARDALLQLNNLLVAHMLKVRSFELGRVTVNSETLALDGRVSF